MIPKMKGLIHPTLVQRVVLHPTPEPKYKTLKMEGPIHPTLAQRVMLHPTSEPKYRTYSTPMIEGPIHPTLALHPAAKPKYKTPMMGKLIHLTHALHPASELKYKPPTMKGAKTKSRPNPNHLQSVIPGPAKSFHFVVMFMCH